MISRIAQASDARARRGARFRCSLLFLALDRDRLWTTRSMGFCRGAVHVRSTAIARMLRALSAGRWRRRASSPRAVG